MAKGKDKPSKFPLEVHDGELRLKRTHEHYYQVQGQLELANRSYCDYVVQSDNDFLIDRIQRDRDCWARTFPLVRRMYMKAILP